MSSNITDPADPKKPESGVDLKNASPSSKGKGKDKDQNMEDDDEDDDEDEEIGSEDEEGEPDDLKDIDPTAIVGRRTRGVKVDYTSKEALEKAGLQANEKDEEESDEDVVMKD